MKSKLSQIEFYIPDIVPSSKQELVQAIINTMKEEGGLGYSGYINEVLLQENIIKYIGNGDILEYKNITEKNKEDIEKIIEETIDVCNLHLPVPLENYVFVYPYLPTKEESIFEGVMAIAAYNCVFHIFISLKNWTEKSLKNTIAHELNHTIYYHHHSDNFNKYTLLDNLLLEGLAENFRERFFDKKITPWAGALSREEGMRMIEILKKEFESTDKDLINEILFGSDEYKKWTGYSVGYWIVRNFIEENPDVSWDQLMKQNIYDFIK